MCFGDQVQEKAREAFTEEGTFEMGIKMESYQKLVDHDLFRYGG